MSSPQVKDEKNSQVTSTIKFLFDSLIVKSPVTVKDIGVVGNLCSILNENQSFKTRGTTISRKNPLDDLQTIRKALKENQKTLTVLKTWIGSFRPALMSKIRVREDIEGIKVLQSPKNDPCKVSHDKVSGFLRTLYWRPNPDFEKNASNSSLIRAVHLACRNEAISCLEEVKTWSLLKDKLKEFMVDSLCDLKPTMILAECGIDVPNWDDFVKNEEVFNTYPALCLPFLARMLEVNIEVLQYPDTEIVNFFCGQSDEDVTIKLCSYGNKFAHLVPINLNNVNMEEQRSLKEKITKLKEEIKSLKKQLEDRDDKTQREKRKLELELEEKKQELEKIKQELKEAQEKKRQEMKEMALDLVEKFFNKHVKMEDGSDEC